MSKQMSNQEAGNFNHDGPGVFGYNACAKCHTKVDVNGLDLDNRKHFEADGGCAGFAQAELIEAAIETTSQGQGFMLRNTGDPRQGDELKRTWYSGKKWWRVSSWRLHLLLETLKEFPESFVVEEFVSMESNCSKWIECKTWRKEDGTFDEKSSSVPCYHWPEGPQLYYKVSSDALRHGRGLANVDLRIGLCKKHFIEHFPEFAEKMGIKPDPTDATAVNAGVDVLY
jgi:hypothetical protein